MIDIILAISLPVFSVVLFKEFDKHKVNTKVTFFTEKMRQKHLDFVKTFRDHPNFTPMDQTAAVFSNASYLDGADDINNYLKI